MPVLCPENLLLKAWDTTRKRMGKKTAILDPEGNSLRTFAEIETEAKEIQERVSNLPEGSVVGMQLGNHPAWAGVLLGLWRAGLVAMPLPDYLQGSARDAILQTVNAASLINELDGTLNEERRSPFPLANPWNDRPPILLKLTSGTTSEPRAIRFRAESLLADCQQICRGMGLSKEDINFGVIPFSHSYGMSNLLTPLIVQGTRLVASNDRLPRAILNALTRTEATVFPGTPYLFQNLTQIRDLPPLPHLRLCISAGAYLPPTVANLFRRRFGRKIHVFYGASECGGISYDQSDTEPTVDSGIGTPLPGVNITMPTKKNRRLLVRGPAVGDDFFPMVNRKILGNGTFSPDDLIGGSEQGMTLLGRISDAINIGGRKLNPSEVEVQIAKYPGVKVVAVFGVPSTVRGEEAIAWVVGDGLDAKSVWQFCHSELPSWQVPRDLWVVDEIPQNNRGKISRKGLAKEYLAKKSIKITDQIK